MVSTFLVFHRRNYTGLDTAALRMYYVNHFADTDTTHAVLITPRVLVDTVVSVYQIFRISIPLAFNQWPKID